MTAEEKKEQKGDETKETLYQRGWRDGFEEGKKYGVNSKRMLMSINDEVEIPVEFDGYVDDQEREEIANIVEMPEYKMFFRQNLIRQAAIKHRQAREYMQKPHMIPVMHMLGDLISELVIFYDNARSHGQTKIEPYQSHGYDELPDM